MGAVLGGRLGWDLERVEGLVSGPLGRWKGGETRGIVVCTGPRTVRARCELVRIGGQRANAGGGKRD